MNQLCGVSFDHDLGTENDDGIELAKWFEKLKRDFNDGKGWIDWKKYHESRKKDARDKRLKDKCGSKKGRYRKDEISDDTKEELK